MLFEGCIEAVDVGLVVLVVMEVHGLRVDVRLESFVCVGQSRN
jgi:hypothetical protein